MVIECFMDAKHFNILFLKATLRKEMLFSFYQRETDSERLCNLHRITKTRTRILTWSLTLRKTIFPLFIFFTSTVTSKGESNNKSNKRCSYSNWGSESTDQNFRKKSHSDYQKFWERLLFSLLFFLNIAKMLIWFVFTLFSSSEIIT